VRAVSDFGASFVAQPDTAKTTLSATGLALVRGDRCLFEDVDLALQPGELLVLSGANGCGKTSLLKGIAGLLEFEAGEVCWKGSPVRDDRHDFHASFVWLADKVGLKADLTPLENLYFESGLRPQADTDLTTLMQRLKIERLGRLPLRSLSAGQQRRVALARLLLTDAALWLLDEPFTNLDREGRNLVTDLVHEHLGKGGLCIIAAHHDIEIDAPTRRLSM